jgi:hypothetical protein
VEEGLINEAKDATYREKRSHREIHTDEKDARCKPRSFLLIALPRYPESINELFNLYIISIYYIYDVIPSLFL